MAPSAPPPPVKRSGRPRNKKFVLPVVPNLPQINTMRKNDEIAASQTDRRANGFSQDVSEDGSRRASSNASLNLLNGMHIDELPEASGEGAAAKIRASSVAGSPLSQPVSTTIDPSSELQLNPSDLFEPSAPASTSSTQPTERQIQPDRPTSPVSNTNAFNFASNLSPFRTPRTREHQITFHAPLESPSPSRNTHPSLSEQPLLRPPRDLSQSRIASAAPELRTPGSQERETPVKQQPYSQEIEAAELPAQSHSHSPPDSQPAEAVSQPESTLGPVAPSSTESFEIGSLDHSYNVLQAGGDESDRVKPSDKSYNSRPHPMKSLNFNANSTQTQAETQNSFNEQLTSPFRQLKSGNQPNGLVHSNEDNAHSVSSEDRLPPSDLEEDAFLPLPAHLTRLFITKEWVDWSIEVTSPITGLHPVGYVAHGIVMARSPALRQEMRHHLLSNRVDRVIALSPDRYIQPQAFEAALRYLYIESLMTKLEVEEMLPGNGGGSERLTRQYQLDIVLSYWMAGLILGLRLVAHQAMELVHQLMDWDVVEFVFQQASNLGERSLEVSVELSNTNQNTPGSSSAGSVTPASPPKPQQSPFSPSSGYYSPTAYLGARPRYQCPAINAIMSKQMKKIVYEFLSQRIDVSKFDIEDPPVTILKPYLPATHEYSNSSRYRANPALAAIRFGDVPPAEEDVTRTKALSAMSRESGKVTSVIMLSLTYDDLRQFCLTLKEAMALQLLQQRGEAADIIHGHVADTLRGGSNQGLYPPRGVHLHGWIQEVVAERERRRRKVLSSKTVLNQERLSNEQAWHVVGWEEYIRATDEPLGWDLRRKWTGFTLPARQ